MLNCFKEGEEPLPVELQARAIVAEQLGAGIGLFEPMNLSPKVVFLSECRDPGVELDFTALQFAHHPFDFRTRDFALPARTAYRPDFARLVPVSDGLLVHTECFGCFAHPQQFFH